MVGERPGRLRVLVVASHFPKPGHPVLGAWALTHARALQGPEADVEVLSLTSWVPGVVGRLPRIVAGLDRVRPWATAPREHDWDGLRAHYPRWPLYHTGPPARWARRHPRSQLAVAWPLAARRVLQIVDEFRPDVLHAQNSAVNGFVAHRILSARGIPYLVTEHDFGELRACRDAPRQRALYDRVAAGAATVVTVNRRMEAELRALFPTAEVRTIHNGTEPVPEAVRSTPRPPGLAGRLIVLAVGGLFPRKGMALLVDAFARVAGKHPGAILRIVGEGRERAAIEAAARAAGLEGRIQLTGEQPHAVALQEMAWCDVFALVGWDEPFATAFLEAMAAGAPIVWSADGGIGDVVRDGVHGLAAPPRDVSAAAAALDRLLSDADLRTRMGKAARQLVESRLTIDVHSRAMLDLLRSAARER